MYFELVASPARTPLRQPLRRLWTRWSHLLCSSLWCDIAKLPLTHRRLHERVRTPCGSSDHLLNGLVLPCLVSSHQDPNTQRSLCFLAEHLRQPWFCRLVATAKDYFLTIISLFPKRCVASACLARDIGGTCESMSAFDCPSTRKTPPLLW